MRLCAHWSAGFCLSGSRISFGSCGGFLISLDASTFAATSARTVSRSQTDPAFASCLQSSQGRHWRTRGSGRRSRDFGRAGPLVVTVRFGRGQSTADCSQQRRETIGVLLLVCLRLHWEGTDQLWRDVVGVLHNWHSFLLTFPFHDRGTLKQPMMSNHGGQKQCGTNR